MMASNYVQTAKEKILGKPQRYDQDGEQNKDYAELQDLSKFHQVSMSVISRFYSEENEG